MLNTTSASLSKEATITRMFQSAARAWGMKDAGIDNFDPLVRLLVEACAVEIYRIDNEIAAVQGTITERLAGLLLPEVHAQPRPAHAVIHAASADDYMYVSMESQFLYQKRVASEVNGPLDTNLDLFFSPAGRYKTISGDVLVMAGGACLYNINKQQQKAQALRTAPGKSVPAHTVWIGIDPGGATDLTDLSLFFDLVEIADKDGYLKTLSHVSCFFNGAPVKMSKGLSRTSFEEHGLDFEDGLEELYINRELEKTLSRTYSNHFLTIDVDNPALAAIDASILKNYPSQFAQYFDASELKQLNKPLLWLELRFPPQFSAPVLDALTIVINCFPICNRHLNKINYRLNSYFNIIPLLTNEQFFAVREVEGTISDSNGRTDYVYYPFDSYDYVKKGTYTVRTGNLERFDSRNAAEYLSFLVELLRDESRAFAAFGQDMMASTIKELNQNINLIDQKIKQNIQLLQTAPSYLLISPIEESDTIYVQFWSCNGVVANGIRKGAKIDLYEGSAYRKESLTLMTNTEGGMDKLQNTEILTAFKSVLLSRGRLVTAVDVRNFCLMHLQGRAADVTVGRGVAMSTQPNQGLMQVVQVAIKPVEERPANAEEWEMIKMALEAELKERSAVEVNYKIEVR